MDASYLPVEKGSKKSKAVMISIIVVILLVVIALVWYFWDSIIGLFTTISPPVAGTWTEIKSSAPSDLESKMLSLLKQKSSTKSYYLGRFKVNGVYTVALLEHVLASADAGDSWKFFVSKDGAKVEELTDQSEIQKIEFYAKTGTEKFSKSSKSDSPAKISSVVMIDSGSVSGSKIKYAIVSDGSSDAFRMPGELILNSTDSSVQFFTISDVAGAVAKSGSFLFVSAPKSS